MDAYNANPTSMMAALQTFEKIKDDSKVLILGDMFELGEAAQLEHEAIVDYLKSVSQYVVLLAGENFYATKTSAPHINKVASFSELPALMKTLIPQNSTILIKGSRGMALERCLEYL